MLGPLVGVKVKVAVKDVVARVERVVGDEQWLLNGVVKSRGEAGGCYILEPIICQLLCQSLHHYAVLVIASHHLRVDDRLHTINATFICIARLLEGLRFALLLRLFVLHRSRHCCFFLQFLVGTKVRFCCNNAFFQSFRELFASSAIQYRCKSPHYRSNNECF